MIFHLVQNQLLEDGNWKMATPLANSYIPTAKRPEGV